MKNTDVSDYPGLTRGQHAFYNENGYLIIEKAIEPIGLGRVREAFERRESETRAEWQRSVREGTYTHDYGNGPNAHQILPDFDSDTVILDLAANPMIIPLAAQLVGPDYQVIEMVYHNHHAGADAHTKWHRDWPLWSHPTYSIKIKVFYFLDDQQENMGCFALVPGTHKNPEKPPRDQYQDEAIENMPGMKKMVLNAGDALIWNVICWHAGLANTSADDRRLAIFGYQPFFVKNWISETPPPGIINWSDTPLKRQLMGIHNVHSRRSWDRTDVPYLPEHVEIAMAKNL